MDIAYEVYLDKIYGGWLGKCIGGTIGARFEGQKHWIEPGDEGLFPDEVPPNDDLDLPVLWLKVLEEKGTHVRSDDLAEAWLEHCWYPFNEYGIFRRNWRLGIRPPLSGRFGNAFWTTGMGCTVRSELWGYIMPGAPDVAARYVDLDGCLDHGEQGIRSQQALMAMASMAFFVDDVERLVRFAVPFAPREGRLARAIDSAFDSWESGLDFRDARERTMLLGGHPETSDTFPNIPTIFLALLYGGGDMERTLRLALQCAYDTDTTLAMTGALLGQILGARRIPAHLRDPIGDELVMGIAYHRPEMTLSALARDTARMGVLFSDQLRTGVRITGAPALDPLPAYAPPATRLRVEYDDGPEAAPGETVRVRIAVDGELRDPRILRVAAPAGWEAVPAETTVSPLRREARVSLHAHREREAWPRRNIFTATLAGQPRAETTFGIAGAALWKMLGVFFDTRPESDEGVTASQRVNHHFISLDKAYMSEPGIDIEAAYRRFSTVLGREAIVPAYEHEVDPTRLIGLQGECCIYLARTAISPDDREVHIVIGNTDPFRLYVNGEHIGEARERMMWCPFNHSYRVPFRAGRNTILLKLLRYGEHGFRFTLGLRPAWTEMERIAFNCADWQVDMADAT